MVRFWTPLLFLKWNTHRLQRHSISHKRVHRFWYSKLDKFGVVEGFRPLHSPTLPKQTTLPLAAKPNPIPLVPLLNWLTMMTNWGSLHDTQLKTDRRYVFSSSILVLSCLQDSTTDCKPSQSALYVGVGALTELDFSSRAILASCLLYTSPSPRD